MGNVTTAWAFAIVNRQEKKLFTALARTFAIVNWLDEELFTVLALYHINI